MDINIAIQLDLLSDQQPIHNPPESRPPSSASGGSLDEEDAAGAVWDELEAVFRAQEEVILRTEGATLVGDEHIDEDARFDASGIRRDTPSTPSVRKVNTLTMPSFSRPSRPLISRLGPDPDSPDPTPSRPLSPLRLPIPGVEYEHQPRPSASQPPPTLPAQEPLVTEGDAPS
jgi:hypothetical protein